MSSSVLIQCLFNAITFFMLVTVPALQLSKFLVC